jgi:hypothetical protein
MQPKLDDSDIRKLTFADIFDDLPGFTPAVRARLRREIWKLLAGAEEDWAPRVLFVIAGEERDKAADIDPGTIEIELPFGDSADLGGGPRLVFTISDLVGDTMAMSDIGVNAYDAETDAANLRRIRDMLRAEADRIDRWLGERG